MQSLSEVSLSDFKQALDQKSVRVSQIIFFGLAAGVVLFSFAVGFLYLNQKNNVYNPDMIQTVNLMSLLVAVAAVSSLTIGKILFEKQFSRDNLASAASRDFMGQDGSSLNLSPAQKCLFIIRTASIIRMATMEGAAFFGLATTMNVVLTGIGSVEPLYYLNMLSVLPLLAYVVVNFPTAEKLEETFKTKIQKLN
jgi:hypothetical protein